MAGLIHVTGALSEFKNMVDIPLLQYIFAGVFHSVLFLKFI